MSVLRPSGLPAGEFVRDLDETRPQAPVEAPRAFAEPPLRRAKASTPPPAPAHHGPEGQIALAAEPLPPLDDPTFGRLFDRFGDARVVLLGEASHGASEAYRARAAITRWLVETRGFNMVALETDGSIGRALDARVRGRGRPLARPAEPGWRWRNAEFDALVEWLAAHNRGRSLGGQTGIHGLDLYELSAATRAVTDRLERADADAGRLARERFGGVSPWTDDPASGRCSGAGRFAALEPATTSMLADRLARQMSETAGSDEALLGSAEAAQLNREAEAYYRTLYYGGAAAWNARATHMHDTLSALLAAKGHEAKVVVWAHNAQVGDAAATAMGVAGEAVSLGQLCRQTWGDDAHLIGFGTHAGTVACAGERDAEMAVRTLPPPLADSHEHLAHAAGVGPFLLDLRPHAHSAVRRTLAEPRPERFVGATYRPEADAAQYATCRLPEQFDAWVWFEETRPVTV